MTFDRAAMAAMATSPPSEGPPKISWTQQGQDVHGDVTRVEFDKQIQGQPEPAHLMEVNDEQHGPVTVWLSTTQLRSGFLHGVNQLGRRVQVGDRVYIRYDGEKPSGPGKSPTKLFSIALVGPQGQGQQASNAPTQVQPPQQQPQPAPQPQQQAPQQQWPQQAAGAMQQPAQEPVQGPF